MKIKELSAGTIIKDSLTGVIIALVSIPISMGYAQVSGLPAVCGLYGSIFPILIFGLLSSSKQFIFGVDAAPAALVGAFLAALGIESGSAEAVQIIPFFTFLVGIWLLIMFFLKAGRLVNYISTPVMGGFISGISSTIILMQIPKILGGQSGRGELIELAEHIVTTCRESFNHVSLILGASALAVLLISKKFVPKLPMSIPVMIAGALIGYSGIAQEHGVVCLENVSSGLPAWKLPHFSADHLSDILTTSLTVAVVIMAETLLASNNFANKNGYKIDNNREILVYSLGNLAASFTGCCPVNGSVSRTSMGEQYGGKSQVMSIAASLTMVLILLFGTGFIQYLPVPVLTAIVISALLGAVEFDLMKRLFRQDRKELFIFFGAFFGVLVFGTVYGVMIGIVLSFVSVIIRTANPKRSFLGVISGHEGFHSLERNTYAVPLKNAVIYRFSGNLYFANIGIFNDDIESAVKDDTRCVIVDSGAICSIDISAADRIALLQRSLEAKGIRLYFASHIGALNDRFRQLGLGHLVENGFCRRTIPSALLDAGIRPPYETEGAENAEETVKRSGNADRLEFEWAFGEDADAEIERYTRRLLENIDTSENSDSQLVSIIKAGDMWKGMSEADQVELLAHLQTHIRELSEKLGISEKKIAERIQLRRLRLAERAEENDPRSFEMIRRHNERFEELFAKEQPELYSAMISRRRETLDRLRSKNPEYSKLIDEFYREGVSDENARNTDN